MATQTVSSMWGQNIIKVNKLTAAGALSTTWTTLPVAVEGSFSLTTTAGDRMEARIEGGGLEDVKYKPNTATVEFEIRAGGGRDTPPIAHVNGVVDGRYALQIQPENTALNGIQIDMATARCEETWTAEEGFKWKYTFDVLMPTDGQMIKFKKLSATA